MYLSLFGTYGRDHSLNTLADDLRATLEGELSPDDFATAWARGAALDLLTTVDALIAEFGDTS